MFDKRTIRVLGSLVVGMTLVSALLLALEPGEAYRDNPLALSALDMSSDSARGEILGHVTDRRWDFIIIHDSFGVTGGMSELDKAWNLEYARQNLPELGAGYHFVVSDGFRRKGVEVEIAPKWKDQRDGGYISGEHADKWNREAIGVCLMGDADNRPFGDDQIDATVKLVRMLQEEYDIPRNRVFIHTGRSADSLAPFFPAAEFRKRIRE